jgi:hypothetical protein
MGVDQKIQAEKFFMPNQIGHRFSLFPAAEQNLKLIKLYFVERILEMSVQPGTVCPKRGPTALRHQAGVSHRAMVRRSMERLIYHEAPWRPATEDRETGRFIP